MRHVSCRDIDSILDIFSAEIEPDIMTDKFTQNCYAWFNGGVETIEPRNYFPCGTVNSTSVGRVSLE